MANGVPNPLIRYVIALKDPKVLSLRYVNVPEKIKDLMLITYLFSTYLWYFSPDPKNRLALSSQVPCQFLASGFLIRCCCSDFLINVQSSTMSASRNM